MDQYMRDNQLIGMPTDGGAAKPGANAETNAVPDTARTEAKSNRS